MEGARAVQSEIDKLRALIDGEERYNTCWRRLSRATRSPRSRGRRARPRVAFESTGAREGGGRSPGAPGRGEGREGVVPDLRGTSPSVVSGGADGRPRPDEEDEADFGSDNDATSHYDFGSDETTEMQSWHDARQAEFEELSANTQRALAGEGVNADYLLWLMREWLAFSSGISRGLRALSEFRRHNPQYPPSAIVSDATRGAAEAATDLLDRVLGGEGHAPGAEGEAYRLAMQAWADAHHASAGDRCEEILERYGERFEGDVDRMPRLGSHKTVLEAHSRSCPSHRAEAGGPSPGEKALAVSSLVASVYAGGDLFLRPDAELYSHAVAAARNTLLDWRMRRRLGGSKEGRSPERDLALGLLDALGAMEARLREESQGSGKDGLRLSLRRWHCVVRAYADAIAVVGRIPVGAGDDTAERLLTRLEQFISTNASSILLSMDEAGSAEAGSAKEDIALLIGDLRRDVEGAYTSAFAIRGPFEDFNAALEHAVSCNEAFRGMVLLVVARGRG